MKTFLRRLVWAMLLGVALYGAFVVYAGYRDIRSSLGDFRWSAFGLALVLATANYGLRFLKWQYYLARLGVRGVTTSDSLLIFLSGFVLTVTPGKVGEVFKSALLAETHGVPAARTAPIVIAERLTDVIAVIALIVLGSAGFSGGLRWAAIGAALVALGLAFVIWPAPMQRLLAWLERKPRLAQNIVPKLKEAWLSLQVVAGPAALLVPTLLSIVGWGAEGLALYTLLWGFGTPAPLALTVFFYATATLAGAIVPVPGGLGVAESMIQQQLVHLGKVPQAPATAAMILIRLATLWWAVAVGFIALALLRKRYPDLLQSRPAAAPAGVP